MADRTSAALYARIFERLAKNPTRANKEMAREHWAESQECDFHPCQMDCDEALGTLGLAKVIYDVAQGDAVTVYANYDASGWQE